MLISKSRDSLALLGSEMDFILTILVIWESKYFSQSNSAFALNFISYSIILYTLCCTLMLIFPVVVTNASILDNTYSAI